MPAGTDRGWLLATVAAIAVLCASVMWLVTAPVPTLESAAEASFLQLVLDEEVESEQLDDYCNNEMRAVQDLLAAAPQMSGAGFLWTANQIGVRLTNAACLAELLREVHPEAAVREAAGRCIAATSANGSAVSLSRPLYDAFARLRSTQRRRRSLAATLPPNKATDPPSEVVTSHDAVRFVAKSIEAFERRGVGVVPAEAEAALFQRLKALQATMTDLAQRYDEALSRDRRGVWVAVTETPLAAAAAAQEAQTQQQQQQQQQTSRALANVAAQAGFNGTSNAALLAGVDPTGPATLEANAALPLSAAVSLAELPADYLAPRLRTITPEQWATAVAARKAEADRAASATGDAGRLEQPFRWPAPLPAASPAPLTVLEISTDYPDSGPAIRYALDRRLRAAVALQSSRRGFPGNLRLLAGLLQARAAYAAAIAEAKAGAKAAEQAQGVKQNAAASELTQDSCSYAALSLQPSMAKTIAAVRTLLQTVQSIAQPPAEQERAALTALLEQEMRSAPTLAGDPVLPATLLASDVARLVERARQQAYNVSAAEARQFFTYAHARRGVLTTAARLFGLRFAVVAAPSLMEGGLGSKEKDREIDVCLQPHFAQALPVCEHSVVTPLDDSAVAQEAAAVPEAHRWHPSVEVIDVYRSADNANDDGELTAAATGWTSAFTSAARGDYVGRLYIDAFPRANKYKHMAMFPVHPGLIRWREPSADDGSATPGTSTSRSRRTADARFRSSFSRAREYGDGTETVTAQRPEAALVCNFDPHGPMEHGDVVTLFHEMGHAIHHLLGGTDQRFADFSGSATETDFVEVPSQLNEAFAWDERVLASFAARKRPDGASQEDGSEVEVIPPDLVRRMKAADAAGRALAAWRQVHLSQLSLRLHTGEFNIDPDLSPSSDDQASDGQQQQQQQPAAAAGGGGGGNGGRRTVAPQGAGQQQLEPNAASSSCPPPTGSPVSVTAAALAVEAESSPFSHFAGSHTPANFGHLTGYGAQYYAYSWSDVIVKDMLQPFEEAKRTSGLAAAAESQAARAEEEASGRGSEEAERDPTAEGSLEDPDAGSLLAARRAAHRYARDVLSAGGRLDGSDLVRAFLGRPFEYDAYKEWLAEGANAPWMQRQGPPDANKA